MAKILIRIDISPEILIFSPSVDALFSPPYSGRARTPCSAASSRHPIYDVRILLLPHLTSLVQMSFHWTSEPLILNTIKVKIGGDGGTGKLTRRWRRPKTKKNLRWWCDFLLWGKNIDTYRYYRYFWSKYRYISIQKNDICHHY